MTVACTQLTEDIVDTIEDRIVAVLRAKPGIHYCDGCLALEAKATLTEAQAGVAALDGDNNFTVTQDLCGTCGRRKVVVCAVRPGAPKVGPAGGAT